MGGQIHNMKKSKLLHQDEFNFYINNIIQRDYFPEIATLLNELEWLEALHSGDKKKMIQAQTNIHSRLFLVKPVNSDNLFRNSIETYFEPLTAERYQSEKNIKTLVHNGMMLDEFCALYDGEDHEVLDKIVGRENKKLRNLKSMTEKSRPTSHQAPTNNKYMTPSHRLKCQQTRYNLTWYWKARNPTVTNFPVLNSNNTKINPRKHSNVDIISLMHDLRGSFLREHWYENNIENLNYKVS